MFYRSVEKKKQKQAEIKDDKILEMQQRLEEKRLGNLGMRMIVCSSY